MESNGVVQVRRLSLSLWIFRSFDIYIFIYIKEIFQSHANIWESYATINYIVALDIFNPLWLTSGQIELGYIIFILLFI